MIPFEVPDRFLAAVARGAVCRIGTTLRDRATGRIVAHLQETGLLQRLVSTGVSPAGLLLSVGQLTSSIVANVQLEQVKAMLSGLQLLTGASLAASVVGVGVSAAGFALVLRRLGNLERSLACVRREVLATRLAVERVDAQLAAAQRALVESLLERAEEAWVRFDAAAVWRQLDGPLDQAQRYWRGLVGGRAGGSILLDPRFTPEEAVAAYEATLTLAAARVQALLLLEEHAAALHHAREFHHWHEEAVQGLSPIDIAAARSAAVAEAEGVSEADARSRLLRTSQPFMDGVREVQLRVGHRPALIQTLIDRGIAGREYIEAVRDATDVPLVLLTPA
jgi:hypothetical protein